MGGMMTPTVEATQQTALALGPAYDPAPWLLALHKAQVIEAGKLHRLLSAAGGARELWEAPQTFLKSQRLSEDAIARWLALRDTLDPQSLLEHYRAMDIHLLTLWDPDYPPMLKEIHHPPVLLYLRGNRNALVGKTLGVVGTRRVSQYGRQVAERIISDLAPARVTVVSGLAQGVDGVAHQAALNHQLPTVAVLGTGIDIIYPSTHKTLAREILASGGAIISEYPPGLPGDKFTFPQRNRIIAGLSYGVLVAEGARKSGALITARLATEEGRTVFAVPGNIFSPGSEGPHYLIRNGAVPVTGGQDILEELSWLAPEPGKVDSPPQTVLPSDLSAEERRVLEQISYDPISLETLQQRCGIEISRLSPMLTLLELDGYVASLPGARICRT
jgi:DNA processing protein